MRRTFTFSSRHSAQWATILPGMIRAYGDRALFQRFKWRFIFAPIFLVVVCAAFSIWDLKEMAAAECEAAVRLAPKSAQAHHSYGAFLEKHGKLDEATAQYREAVRADPSLADAQIDLGTALLEKGDLAGAKEHLQTASKLDPKLAQPHNYLGKIFMREGNVSSAIAQFEEALRLHPDFPEAEENLRMAKASDGGSLTLSPR